MFVGIFIVGSSRLEGVGGGGEERGEGGGEGGRRGEERRGEERRGEKREKYRRRLKEEDTRCE